MNFIVLFVFFEFVFVVKGPRQQRRGLQRKTAKVKTRFFFKKKVFSKYFIIDFIS